MCVEQQIDTIQQNIVSRFTEMDDPLFTYEMLLDTARRYPSLPACYKIDEFKVEGCQRQAWLHLTCENDRFMLMGESDTLVVRGIIALLAEAFNGQRCEDVALAPVDYLQKAGVMDTFDATRRSGIGKIVETIQVFAHEHSLAR